MKKLLPLIAIASLLACNNQQTITTTSDTTTDSTVGGLIDFKQEQRTLDSALQQLQTPSQFFKAPLHHPVTFTCAKGTQIEIDPRKLTTISGREMDNHIDVEVKELTDQQELALSQAGTISNGELLESGGAYYINLTSGGEQLKLKDGETLNVRLATISNDGMSVFYGKRDGENLMNWLPAPVQLTHSGGNVTDTVETEYREVRASFSEGDTGILLSSSSKTSTKARATKKIKTGNVAYEAVALTELGWINCDKFRKEKNLTTLYYQQPRTDSINAVKAFLVFRSINSVMESKAIGKNKGKFIHVPAGKDVIFVAVGFRSGKYFSYKTPLSIAADQNVDVVLKETTLDNVKMLFRNR